MDRVNTQRLSDIIAKIMQAVEDGKKIDFHDADEIGQFVCAVLGLGASLIPVIGSSVGALCNLLGVFFFTPHSMEHIWDALRERIERLIDHKIEEYHLKVLKAKIKGFQDNLDLYSQYLKDFDDASTDEKKDAASTLKPTHIAFLAVLLAGIPEF
jgi:hypothetical protein